MNEDRSDVSADIEQRKAALMAQIKDPALLKTLAEISDSLKSAPSPAPALMPKGPPPLPETDAAICATIAHTFTMSQAIGSAEKTAPNSAPEACSIWTSSDDERSAILANSTPIMIAGQRRLQLSDEARGDLLTRVHGSERFERFRSVLSNATRLDQDAFKEVGNDDVRLPGAWLRSFLEGTSGDVFKAPPREVRAAVDALSRLRFAGPGVVKSKLSLTDAQRALELSQLLEPLRILVGMQGDWNGVPLKDRFVGRQEELTRLRAFVDELHSATTYEAVTRGFERIFKGVRYFFNISDESVFFLIARGGIGKTTLLAKFVLDHALNQSRRFPFVYFDFDRATLHTRDPRQLLLEAVRQVALQFPEEGPEFAELAVSLRDEIAAGGPPSTMYFDRFRDLVKKLTHGSRAFLVVLDTMEVVQYDPASLAAVINFVTYLNGQAANFPELRIVASGRADVPELRTELELRSDKNRLILQPLSFPDAVLMAGNVGRDFLGSEWQARWETSVAGNPSDPPERREPLVIRVAIELIRSCKRDERERLVQSIANDGENASVGENASESFVGLLYERRILEHVQDEEVRKLAWPGLVVRRVTRDIIATTLAPICELDPDSVKVDRVFKALANEVWMVEEEDNGEVLRHRPDLRARTLPLMRKRNPEKFDAVNSAVRRYYEARQRVAKDHAEWLYHRLLGNEHPDSVDRDWTDEMSTLLAGAADDFAPDSEARAYLLGRTANTLLPPKSIQQLSPQLALDHIARTGAQLGSFDDTRIEPVVMSISQRIANPQVASSYPHPAKAVLLAKTGQWNVPASFDGGAGEWREHAEFARRFVQVRNVGGVQDGEIEPIDGKLPLRTLVQALAAARLARSPNEQLLDGLVAERLREAAGNLGPSDFAALRTAVVFGWQSSIPAAREWLVMQDSPSSPKAISLAEISALLDLNRLERRATRSALEPILKKLSINWNELAANARARTPKAARIGYPEFRVAVFDRVRKLLDGDNPDNIHVLRRFFAARNDDWTVPLGYAAARVLGDSSRVVDLFGRLVRENQSLATSEPGFRQPEDALQLFRWADEAANTDGTAAAVLDMASGPEAADLRQMRVRWKQWRERIDELLGRNEAEGADDPPSPDAVLHADDPQKGRWGELPERNGRRLEATLKDSDRDTFDVDLTVRSTDQSPLEGPVLFHLHDSFPRKTIYIRRIRDGSFAVLEEVNTYGVFTVGAQVKASDGRWTGLELDLVNLKGLPRRFRDR
ncbi:hypothetical protein ACVMFA_009502 [Bradyrhizobium liaoningense]